jgi:hypothetical protein
MSLFIGYHTGHATGPCCTALTTCQVCPRQGVRRDGRLSGCAIERYHAPRRWSMKIASDWSNKH